MAKKKIVETVENEMLQNPGDVETAVDSALSGGDAPDMSDAFGNPEEIMPGEGELLPDGGTSAVGESEELEEKGPESTDADVALPSEVIGDTDHAADESAPSALSADVIGETDLPAGEPADFGLPAEEANETFLHMEETAETGLLTEEPKEEISEEPEPEDNPPGVETTGTGDTPAGPKIKKPKPKPAQTRKKTIYDLDIRGLDRDLSPEEQREWSAIYASYRSKSVLTGTVIGADQNTFDVMNRETGESETKTLSSLIIIDYRVKVLIPESEMWMPGEERPGFVLRNMVGSEIDYVIMEVDREGECAIGSRRMALAAKRHFFATARGGHKEGDLLKCRVMATGPQRCTVECGGYDMQLTQRDLSYTMIADLREKFHPGQELDCRLKSYDREAGKLVISVKEAKPNPFNGADKRHPIRSRRQAVISGKYRGGVFCTLPDDTVCLCLYSAQHSDMDFAIGDSVIVVIRQYDYDRQLIYGRILAKW